MFHIVLYEPEIPSNTGNIIRLCANTGAKLHLIQPLGFQLEDKKLRRAGLDYHEWAEVREYPSLPAFILSVDPKRLFALSTKAKKRISEFAFQPGDAFLFGPESRGLPASILAELGVDRTLYLPMRPESRSLNLSNSVAIVLYEAWRQQSFAGSLTK
jgi:tRNA (cytidine/uridine-2'-O-)-methyltransferase